MAKPPKRPADVPREATWNAADDAWGLGGTRRGDTYFGEWKWWRKAGGLVCHSFFDDAGELHGISRRFHPNGEVAQVTRYTHGKPSGIWVGFASTAPTTESWVLVSGMNARITRCELDCAKEVPARYRFFLAGDVPCNINGVALSAKAPSFAKVLKRFLHVKSMSFDDAIARGSEFLRAARAISPLVDEIVGETALVRTGTPASKKSLAALEKRYGALPPLWKELLSRFGTLNVACAAGPTTAAPRVSAASKEARVTIDAFAEFDDDEDGTVISSWKKLEVGQGVHLTPKLRAARFVHFADEGASDTHILALDWRDKRGECPILFLPHDEAQFYLEAPDTLAWVNRQIDRAIEKITQKTKRRFG